MQANWSLILNVLLLIGVIAAIFRLMKARKQNESAHHYQPSLGQTNNSNPYEAPAYNDDIIAVRKVSKEPILEDELEYELTPQSQLSKKPVLRTATTAPQLFTEEESIDDYAQPQIEQNSTPATVMMFLLAKENRHFAGYELLQTLLACGLRFGEGQLFHRHQFVNGQEPVLCSLAAATANGTFDLQNIGAFTVRGLCLFMKVANNPEIDEERFAIMLETAKQLSEGMDAHLLDDERKPVNEARLARYYRMLKLEQYESEYA